MKLVGDDDPRKQMPAAKKIASLAPDTQGCFTRKGNSTNHNSGEHMEWSMDGALHVQACAEVHMFFIENQYAHPSQWR
ncbi:Hypothetical predicted protein [Podarcis lilfordi]|uniref:Uncharacterized protein n=1 Tax=Podarcis lilfordi TaxID=74358 RepID=A0AA35JXN8_9SAUR|nr:Hypothetical predicted protein [Podarcis lilfordi]